MTRALARSFALLLLSAAAAKGESPPEPRDATDAIVARAAIEARGRRHGEVRLLRRDGVAVVQTLLATRSLERVAARIREKEDESWPEDREGRAESLRYRDALAAAVAQVLETPASGRTRALAIELRLAPEPSGARGTIVFAVPDVVETADGGALELRSAAELRELRVPCRWLAREMALVASDRGLSLAALGPLPGC